MSRIIAGARGGRRLRHAPRGPDQTDHGPGPRGVVLRDHGLGRPIGLGSDQALGGLSFADLYAGSGAVGLEAASRGAGPVLLVEAARRTASVAARNAEDTELRVQIATVRVERWAREPAEAGST